MVGRVTYVSLGCMEVITRGYQVVRRDYMKTFIHKVSAFVAVFALAFMPLAGLNFAHAAAGEVNTVTGSCGAPVNANQYEEGQAVLLKGKSFEPNTQYGWDISPAAGGPNAVPIASGNVTTDANGDFCFTAIPSLPQGSIDGSPYKATVGEAKSDNFSVKESTNVNGTITVVKTLVNAPQGVTADDFSFKVNGGDAVQFESDGSNSSIQNLNDGPFTVVEVEANGNGYTTSYVGCASIALTTDGATCTITNTYEPQVVLGCTDPAASNYNPNATVGNPDAANCTYTAATGTLSVKKVIVGAEAPYTNFSFAVNGLATTTFEVDGQNDITKTVGTYTVTEAAAEGYTTEYSNCSNVSVTAGQVTTCTITNTKIKTPPQNSCLEPTTDGVQEEFTITQPSPDGAGKSVQEILAAAGYGSVNALTDQINTQTWDVTTLGTDTVTLKVQILGQYAQNSQAFGYYTAGNAGSFAPIAVAPGVNGTTGTEVEVTIPASAVIGFADQTASTWFTEPALNADGAKDHAAVYNPEANVYVIAFEDQNLGDKDHNDLVVKVTVVSCNNEDPTYTIDGYKYMDSEGDGYTGGEQALAGWTINLVANDGGAVVQSTTTDANGYYYFVVENPSLYHVEEVMQANWEQTDTEGNLCSAPTLRENIMNAFSAMVFEDDVAQDFQCDFYNHYTAPLCEVTVVSDDTNTVVEKGGATAKLLSFVHPLWTATVTGASWIWGEDGMDTPDVETTQTFVKNFVWDGPVTEASMKIATDDWYSITINGVAVGASNDPAANYTDATADTYDIASFIQTGNNELRIAVTNQALETQDPQVNPAGLLYKATVAGTDETCGEVPPPDDGGGDDGGGGGGGKRISMGGGDDEDEDEPEGEVLGAQTEVLPAGAPNTGMGGAGNAAATASFLGSFVTMLAGVFALRRKSA